VAIADSWFPEDTGRRTVDGFAPLLAERDVVMTEGIVQALGITQRWLDDEITVRMPTAEEASLLELSEGSLTLRCCRILLYGICECRCGAPGWECSRLVHSSV
jgi:DNA-binding GntR family transcriptional regulator